MTWFQRLFAIFLVKPFFRLFFSFKVLGKKNIENIEKPLLIIANHQSVLDHFALGAALPVRAKIYPYKFMGEINKFNGSVLEFLRKIGFIKILYSLFGVFPAIRGKGLKEALKIPIEIIKKREGIILMYPEGKITKGNALGEFKRGATVLAMITEARILPVALKKENIGLRKRYFVKFGPTFTISKDISCEDGTKHIRNIVEKLYISLF